MPSEVIVRIGVGVHTVDLAGSLDAAGEGAQAAFAGAQASPGAHLLLVGDRDYAVTLTGALDADRQSTLRAAKGRLVRVVFPGKSPVRRRLADLTMPSASEPRGASATALDLQEGRASVAGAAAEPLFLLPDGRVAPAADGSGDRDAALLALARLVSSRRTTSFERLFPGSAFHPDLPARTERLTSAQARGLLAQVKACLADVAVGGARAKAADTAAAQQRSACVTVLSHLLATSLRDPSFVDLAPDAAAALFGVVDAEQGDPTARPALRAHAIFLLQMRAPALSSADQAKVKALLGGLVRKAPPYAELAGAWRFAMCSAYEFHEGECEVLTTRYGFKEVALPADAPRPPGFGGAYRAFEAPFKTPAGAPIQIWARSAQPTNENAEMGLSYFVGLLINRHAQLGSYDMRAATVSVVQQGYKVMMNSQCAGLTTRFAISRMFPDADIESSWDSTYFRTGEGGKVIASEGLDCFVALLEGMSKKETFAQIDRRIRAAQWHHEQVSYEGFSQFIGPSHELFVARYMDVNQDGKADYYDGFLDFDLKAIAEDIGASATPRDPGVRASQISGEAANGLGWAAGSMNRVTQYSDLWASLPGESEILYAFQAGGFYSPAEPPVDVQAGPVPEDLGRLPAVCRWTKTEEGQIAVRCEVMMNAYLAHSGKELKRLLIAADSMQRAFDLGLFAGDATFAAPAARRGAILLMLAGLLEFPADPNRLDGLWSMALAMLGMPDLSRSVVRGCITEEDHDASNYYGSRRGLRQLLESLPKSDPLAFEKLAGPDPLVGRARALAI